MKIDQFQTSGSYFDIGFSVGRQYSQQICQAVSEYPLLQKRFLPYHRKAVGQERYRTLLELHRKWYPDYICELEGLAQGAGVSFEEIFLINFRGEYSEYIRQSRESGCCTCSVLNDDTAVFGHNEDGLPLFKNRLFLLQVRPEGKAAFLALVYPGILWGNALGFNSHGICFAVNYVRPLKIRVGLGRHFLARSVLEARTLDEAIQRITIPDRASGFNYTIGSVRERCIVNVEVAPDAFLVKEIDGWDFHANHYIDLSVPQKIEPSSQSRVKRAEELMDKSRSPKSENVLRILSDDQDKAYPIFRSGKPPDDLATLMTIVFDLDSALLTVYDGKATDNMERLLTIPLL